MLVLIRLEERGLSDFEGRRGIASVVRWNPRSVIFGVETWHVAVAGVACFEELLGSSHLGRHMCGNGSRGPHVLSQGSHSTLCFGKHLLKILHVKMGLFKVGGGGVTEGGGFHTPVRGTMFSRNGAVTPGPVKERPKTVPGVTRM